MDLGRRRTVGLGALSLWPLGLLQQLLGLVSAQLLSPSPKLVASGIGSVRFNRFQFRLALLLVPTFLSSARSAIELFPIARAFDAANYGGAGESSSPQSCIPASRDGSAGARVWQPDGATATRKR